MSSDVHVGTDGWLFLTGGSNEVLRFFSDPSSSDLAKSKWKVRLEERARKANERAIAYRHLIVPDKLGIYPEHYLGNLPHLDEAPSRSLAGYLAGSDKPELAALLVDAYSAMIAAKQGGAKLFFKTDTHWAFDGSWAAYAALCESVSATVNSSILDAPVSTAPLVLDLGGKLVPPLTETYEVRQFASNARRTYANELVSYKEHNNLHDGPGLHVGSHIVLTNDTATDPRTIVLFGDSFSEYRLHLLTGLLSETFAQTHFIWSGAVDWDYVDRVRPDIVVTEQAERFHNVVPADDFAIAPFARERLAEHLDKAVLEQCRPREHDAITEQATAMEQLARLIKLGVLPAPREGLSAPLLDHPEIIQATDAPTLERYGITVLSVGIGNQIVVDRQQSPLGVTIDFSRAVNSLAVFGRTDTFSAEIVIAGSMAACCFAGGGGLQGHDFCRVNIEGDRASAYFGKSTTFVSAQFLVEGEGHKLVCGDDCMFSWGIFARNYDSHCIFDYSSGEPLNAPKDLVIGHHVWVGQDVLITKGVNIGSGSIIAARSTVTNDISHTTVVGGTPARVIRNGASWTRDRYANDSAITQIRRSLGLISGSNTSIKL